MSAEGAHGQSFARLVRSICCLDLGQIPAFPCVIFGDILRSAAPQTSERVCFGWCTLPIRSADKFLLSVYKQCNPQRRIALTIRNHKVTNDHPFSKYIAKLLLSAGEERNSPNPVFFHFVSSPEEELEERSDPGKNLFLLCHFQFSINRGENWGREATGGANSSAT